MEGHRLDEQHRREALPTRVTARWNRRRVQPTICGESRGSPERTTRLAASQRSSMLQRTRRHAEPCDLRWHWRRTPPSMKAAAATCSVGVSSMRRSADMVCWTAALRSITHHGDRSDCAQNQASGVPRRALEGDDGPIRDRVLLLCNARVCSNRYDVRARVARGKWEVRPVVGRGGFCGGSSWTSN